MLFNQTKEYLIMLDRFCIYLCVGPALGMYKPAGPVFGQGDMVG